MKDKKKSSAFTCIPLRILLPVLLACLPGTGEAQDIYFSKVIRGFNDRTAFWDMNRITGSDDLLLSTTRNRTGVYVNSGWLRVSAEGELLDSFFYERNSLTSSGVHPMAVKGDTIFQLYRFISNTDVVQVHGSSLSQKDSLFCWTYDFTHLPNFRWVDGRSCMINSKGNLIITGTYSVRQSSVNVTHLFIMEVDPEGNVLVNQSVLEEVNPIEAEHYSRVVEIGGYYYTCISIYHRQSNELNNYIVKIDQAGNRVWTSEKAYTSVHFGAASLRRKAEVAYSEERGELYVVNNHRLELRDFPGMDPWSDEFADSVALYSHMKIIVSVYDMESGNLLRDYSLLAPAETLEEVFSSQVSQVNGDLVIIGRNLLDVPDNAVQWNAGYFLRMDPVTGEFKYKYKVLDQFGHPWTFGNHFTDLAEDDQGNIYIAGQVNNFVFGSKQPTGWLVKLGIDPCEGMHCQGDTLSGHTFLTSLTDFTVRKTRYLQVFPNPVKAGQTIRLSDLTGQPLPQMEHIRIISTTGQLFLHTPQWHPDGSIRLPLLPPGIYHIEMLKKGAQERYMAKIMVH